MCSHIRFAWNSIQNLLAPVPDLLKAVVKRSVGDSLGSTLTIFGGLLKNAIVSRTRTVKATRSASFVSGPQHFFDIEKHDFNTQPRPRTGRLRPARLRRSDNPVWSLFVSTGGCAKLSRPECGARPAIGNRQGYST